MKKYTEKEEREGKRERPLIYLKRKLMAALSMLLVAAILLTATSYAWLVLSVAPEVTGITTNVGANGSLEIALLNSETYTDLSKIRTGTDSSLAAGSTPNAKANYTWGNLVDLSVADYGLSAIKLMPARLSVAKSGDGYKVNSGLLSVPTYGYDGRIIQLTDNTVTTTYNGNNKFTYEGFQDYGVRVIGTSDAVSVQEAGLTQAKAAIKTYTESARSAAVAALNDNSEGLIGIIAEKMGMSISFGDKGKVETILSMIGGLESSVNYIELAIRHGIVAVAASELSDQDTFVTVRDRILDESKSLQEVVAELSEISDLPESYTTWINGTVELKNDLAEARNAAAELTESSGWTEIRSALDHLMNTDKIYVNGMGFNTLNKDSFTDMLNDGEVQITMATGSGVFADISDYTGDYSTLIEVLVYAVSFTTMTTVDPVYLQQMSDKVSTLEAAGSGDGGALEKFDLTNTFGYALDLAFRCNASAANLLLQTSGVQRVYEDSTAGATMGGGSYMEFSTKDSGFPLAKVIELMDAVRVGFIDDQGNLLGVAKLNTSSRSVEGGLVKASLFLYDFSFDEEGVMVMGERQKGDGKNIITSLEQNVAKAVSVIVWLDGDIVDNSKVSATQEASLYGVLNLQFATDADLIPAQNNDVKTATTNKSDLEALVEEYKPIYEAGQDNDDGAPYTTLSWTAFTEAYLDAVAVINDENADKNQVFYASYYLAAAKEGLAVVSHDTLQAEIDRLRANMGQTEDVARYVVVDAKGNYVAVDPYTMEQFENKIPGGDIYRVDYKMNLRDEGNNVYTPIYTDESWSALAAALYGAEALNMDAEATDAELDAAITSLVETEKALQNKVFFLPYEHNDTLYYYAIPYDPADTDTYGRWYTLDFKRVVEDLTVLTLDAQAEPTVIAEITHAGYSNLWNQIFISNVVPEGGEKSVMPQVYILDELYPSLRDEEIIALQWNVPAGFVEGITQAQQSVLIALQNQLNNMDVDAWVTEMAAEAVNLGTAITKDAAQDYINTLQAEVDAYQPMTDGQLAVLIAQCESAATVDGFADETIVDNAELNVLRQAVLTSGDLIRETEPVRYAVAQSAIDDLNAALVRNGKAAIEEDEVVRADDLQIAMLAYAANYAKTTEGYTGNAGLVSAVSGAETVLSGFPSIKAVSEALAAMNAALAAAGHSEVVEDDVTPAADEQITALQLAVDRARAVENYDNDEITDVTLLNKLELLRGAVTAAEAVLDESYPSINAVKKATADLNAALTANGAEPVDEYYDVVEKRLPATENQLIVLQSAVDSAKSVDGYDKTDKAELDDLRAAVAAAEEILAKDEPNMQETRLATEALNELLPQFGKVARTEHNSVTYIIPLGSERYELVYAVDKPTTNLIVTGEVADDTITAVVLTRNGVVFTAETSISAYSPAAGVQIDEPATLPGGASVTPVLDGTNIVDYTWNGDLTMGNSVKLSASLMNRQKPIVDEEGNPVVDETNGQVQMEDILQTETISTYSWASSDTEVLSIANNNSAVCSLTTKGIGAATITLSVTTKQGNTYFTSINMTVKPAAGLELTPAIDGEATNSNVLESGKTMSFGLELTKRTAEEPDENGSMGMVEVDHGETILRAVWASSDPTILGVDENGVVTPMANGTATVYVGVVTNQGNTYSATYTVTVTGVPAPEEPTT